MSHVIQFDNYRREIEQSLRETREAIEEAMTAILRHEDSPGVMMGLLTEIHEKLDRLESDLSCAHNNFDDLAAMLTRVRRQRDQAIRERDALIAQLERRKREEGHRLYW